MFDAMMTFKITHQTDYTFDSDVFLEPHYLRFRPRSMSHLELETFSIHISPDPAGHRVLQDEENNVLDFCWFNDTAKMMRITTESRIKVTDYNPFGFILYPTNYNQLPFRYEDSQMLLLLSYLEPKPIAQSLLDYGVSVLKESKSQTLDYLTLLTRQLHEDFNVVYREEGPPLLPDSTFQQKEGSCRDLAWMQIHMLRHQGVAARFVSGYYYFEMEQPNFELHAWVEVFLPGAGWIGLDPSHGIFTGNTHFPIASSADYEHTMPVSGGFRGSATSLLDTKLVIEKL